MLATSPDLPVRIARVAFWVRCHPWSFHRSNRRSRTLRAVAHLVQRLSGMNATTQPAPLLAEGDTYESASWRIRRGALSISAQSLVGAGKRGKRCPKIILHCPVVRSRWDVDAEVAAFVRKAARDASVESMLSLARSCARVDMVLDLNNERGVDVQPAGCDGTVEITGACVRVRASATGFAITNMLDVNNEETLIQTDKRSIALVLAWVLSNQGALKSMTFGSVTTELRSLGARTHYFCAVD